jgi:hypothetical protein
MQRLFVLFALGFAALAARAETPRFNGPDTIRDAGVPIDVDYYGAPVMFDWDQDGAKDLICGQFTGGYIRFYRNTGPDSAPAFNGFEYMYASGSQITLPSG